MLPRRLTTYPGRVTVPIPWLLITAIPRKPWWPITVEACRANAVVFYYCAKIAAVFAYRGSVQRKYRDLWVVVHIGEACRTNALTTRNRAMIRRTRALCRGQPRNLRINRRDSNSRLTSYPFIVYLIFILFFTKHLIKSFGNENNTKTLMLRDVVAQGPSKSRRIKTLTAVFVPEQCSRPTKQGLSLNKRSATGLWSCHR